MFPDGTEIPGIADLDGTRTTLDLGGEIIPFAHAVGAKRPVIGWLEGGIEVRVATRTESKRILAALRAS